MRLGFVNVVDAFHVVNQGEVPRRFFIDERTSNSGLRLTEEFRTLMSSSQSGSLPKEIEARWAWYGRVLKQPADRSERSP